MKKTMKFILLLILVLAMFTTTFASSPGIVVHHEKLAISAFNKEGNVLVAIRPFLELLKGTVHYDHTTKMITASRNGKEITLDLPAQIRNDQAMFPVRSISESLGAHVVWADKTVFIARAAVICLPFSVATILLSYRSRILQL